MISVVYFKVSLLKGPHTWDVHRGSVHKRSFRHWAINVADLFHITVDIFIHGELTFSTNYLLYIIITFMSQSKASFIMKDTDDILLV